jgi:molybdopterin-guanine dinucleotide biosynthesis protein A
MGRDKALLEIGGQAMLARIVGRIRPLFDELSIVGGDAGSYGSFGVPVRPDVRPGCGSLGGIFTALAGASSPAVFCVACDMPFVNADLVAYLLETMEENKFQAVIPVVNDEPEPLCAVYSRLALPVIERDLDAGVRRIKDTLSSLRARNVDAAELHPFDPGLRTFFNINTPADLETARKIIGSAPDPI